MNAGVRRHVYRSSAKMSFRRYSPLRVVRAQIIVGRLSHFGFCSGFAVERECPAMPLFRNGQSQAAMIDDGHRLAQ